MKYDKESITFSWWINADGSRGYRFRGFGEIYRKFAREWIPTSSYRDISNDYSNDYRNDFPWRFFVFDDPADHDRLILDFPGNVYEEFNKHPNLVVFKAKALRKFIAAGVRRGLTIYGMSMPGGRYYLSKSGTVGTENLGRVFEIDAVENVDFVVVK